MPFPVALKQAQDKITELKQVTEELAEKFNSQNEVVNKRLTAIEEAHQEL